MGIRSLSDYIFNNYPSLGSWFSIDSSSSEQVWIIDANAVLYFLCSNNDHLEVALNKINAFEGSISKCKCIWVFDGESSLDKLPTQISRASNVDRSSWILLGLISIVISTLREKGVECIVAPGEADGTVAYLAVKYQAKILSNDSDFYIYNTLGYIPLQYLSVENGIISGKIITSHQVANMLGIQIHLLPYFAVLVGNDTFKGYEPPAIGKKISRIKYWANALLSSDQLLKSIDLQNAAQQYQIPKNITYEFFHNKDFSTKASQGKLDPILLKLLHYKIFWCSNLLEDLKRESAWDVSLKIRHEMYSILFPKDTIVTDYCRRGINFKSRTYQVTLNPENTKKNVIFWSFGLSKTLSKIPIHFQPFLACIKALIDYLFSKNTPILDFQLHSLILSGIISWRIPITDISWSSKSPSFIHLKAQMQVLLFTFHLFQQSLGDIYCEVVDLFRFLEPNVLYHCLTMIRKGASVERLLRVFDNSKLMMNDFNLLRDLIFEESSDQISCLT